MIQEKIPQEQEKLFNEYIKRVNSLSRVNTIMWVIFDNGPTQREMIGKGKHIATVQELLTSGDEKKVSIAVEAMSRTLGVWSKK